jgi:hypothetical protein
MKTLNTGLFQTLQFPFNFIEKDPADELFPLAQKMDVGLIGMKPLGGGLLERADLCFGFLRQHPYVVPIPGMCKQKEADPISRKWTPSEPPLGINFATGVNTACPVNKVCKSPAY